MKLAFQIAKRYLFGKKTTNAINVITGISVVGIAIGTAALLLILSVFNGFEDLISGFFNSFNPQIKVYPYEGKKIDETVFPWEKLEEIAGIEHYSKTLEELVLFDYDGIQEVGYLKGVDEYFNQVNTIDSTIRKGRFLLENDERDFAVFGAGLASKLNINVDRANFPVSIYSPSRAKSPIPGKEFTTRLIYASGTFAVQSEEDYKYAFSSLPFLRSMLASKHDLSYVEIKISEDADLATVKSVLQKKLGESYIVKDQYDQDASFLRVMAIEKWLSYAIAVLTLLLIAFNMVGALWMIVLEKKKDLSIFRAMGMVSKQLERIFIFEGLLISMLGFVIGIVAAMILYYLQVNYGIVPIPEGAIIDAYPVLLKYRDIFIVFLTVLSIGFFASLLPAKRAGQIDTKIREN